MNLNSLLDGVNETIITWRVESYLASPNRFFLNKVLYNTLKIQDQFDDQLGEIIIRIENANNL